MHTLTEFAYYLPVCKRKYLNSQTASDIKSLSEISSKLKYKQLPSSASVLFISFYSSFCFLPSRLVNLSATFDMFYSILQK